MTSTPLGNHDLVRGINRSIILNVIKNNGAIDRAKIAGTTGLSPATVTGITSDLIKEGLIFEKEPGDSRGGRRPILLAINPSGACVVGIRLIQENVIGGLYDLEVNPVARHAIPLEDRSPESVVKACTALIQKILNLASVPQNKLIGVGFALAGVVDSVRGIQRQNPFFDWKDLPLQELLQSQINVPVFIDNDINTLTLAELYFGLGKNLKNFLVLVLGRGIGLGVVVNGQIYRGVGGGAGEFGHVVMFPGGQPCHCGKTGCLESYVSSTAMLVMGQEAYQRRELPKPVNSLDDLRTMADEGVSAAQEIYSRTGAILGQGVASLLNLFNPERVIFVCVEGDHSTHWLVDPMNDAIRSFTTTSMYEDAESTIVPVTESGDPWIRGAASLVLSRLFESPVFQ